MTIRVDSETQLDYYHLRANRMFEKSGNWFFYTREGTVEGPYMDEWEAKTWVELYVSFIGSGLPFIDTHLSLKSTKLQKIE